MNFMIVGAIVSAWMIVFGVFLVLYGLRMKTISRFNLPQSSSSRILDEFKEHLQIEPDDLPSYEEILHLPSYEEIHNFPVLTP